MYLECSEKLIYFSICSRRFHYCLPAESFSWVHKQFFPLRVLASHLYHK